MNNNRYIQISTLTTYPASLINRDDSGLSKRISFGGATRTRISSQCLKRHWRMDNGPWSLLNVDESIARSIRSRSIFPEIIERQLIDEGLDPAKVVAASQVFQAALYDAKSKKTSGADKKGKAKKSDNADNNVATSTEDLLSPKRKELIVLGRPEITYLTNAIRDLVKDCDTVEDVTSKADEWFAANQQNFQGLRCGAGLDAAMFGRFVSGDVKARVNAAVHVAHAFTVHSEESEIDYFVAVDDLETMGTAHINSTELTSGIYYTYVVIDVPQLVSNIEGCAVQDWQNANREITAKLVKHMLHLMTTVTPGAKLGSTAPYARPWFVLAETGDAQPRTLADAYLKPVPLHGDMRDAALRQMEQYITACDSMYGDSKNEQRLVASMYDVAIPGAERVSIDDMGVKLENTVLGVE